MLIERRVCGCVAGAEVTGNPFCDEWRDDAYARKLAYKRKDCFNVPVRVRFAEFGYYDDRELCRT